MKALTPHQPGSLFVPYISKDAGKALLLPGAPEAKRQLRRRPEAGPSSERRRLSRRFFKASR